jgi:hypothetical protein
MRPENQIDRTRVPVRLYKAAQHLKRTWSIDWRDKQRVHTRVRVAEVGQVEFDEIDLVWTIEKNETGRKRRLEPATFPGERQIGKRVSHEVAPGIVRDIEDELIWRT